MPRWNRTWVVVCWSLAAAACVVSDPSNGVGDPCLPAQPGVSANGQTCGDGGCFSGSEVYLETASLQCRTHACMVYHWDQGNTGEAQNQRAFCTCRCAGGAPDESLCACPDGFACTPLFGGAGSSGVQGSYCIRSSLSRAQ